MSDLTLECQNPNHWNGAFGVEVGIPPAPMTAEDVKVFYDLFCDGIITFDAFLKVVNRRLSDFGITPDPA